MLTFASITAGKVMETQGGNGVQAIGSVGSFVVPDPWHVRQPGILFNGRELRLDRENSYRHQLENVSAAIHGSRLLLGRDDAVGQARTSDALYRSAQRSQPVRLQ